jgi:hypothetical protein
MTARAVGAPHVRGCRFGADMILPVLNKASGAERLQREGMW